MRQQASSYFREPFGFISMNSIVGFLEVDNMRFVLVIIDRFTKYAMFVDVSNACMADIAVELFHNLDVKYFSVPKDIISDKDTIFIGWF